jgi:threonine dehydrogenase-like Zn-dependent dehydrogenase
MISTSKRLSTRSSQVRLPEIHMRRVQVLTRGSDKFKDVGNMVTSRIYIDDITAKGFDELVTNKDQHIKILVTTHRDKVT